MRRFWIVLIAVISLGAGVMLGQVFFGPGGDGIPAQASDTEQQYTCGMHPEIISDEPGYCPICEMKLTPIRRETATTPSGERKIAYWVAPMDPTYIRNEPGKSPMGMDLVPVYEDEVAGSIIKIDPVISQNMGLKMTTAEQKQLTKEITAVARIVYDEEKLYGVNSKVAGWIEKLYVDFEGMSVKKDDPLLEIYSPELVTAQQEYLSALRNYENLKDVSLESARKGAADLSVAAKDRLLLWDITEEQIENLRQTGAVKKTLTLYSPADGVVISRMVVDGDKVMPGMKLFQVADLSTVWVHADIYEYELPFISMGQEVRLSLSYLPGTTFTGRISFIYPYLNEMTRDVRIRIEIPNPNLYLKPNMYANAFISSSLPGTRVVIPNQAVIRSGLRNLVFISLGDGKFMPREVKLGVLGQNDMIEIISGLNEGNVVVTSSQFMLDSESRLREATSKIRAKMASTTVVKDEPVEVQEPSQGEHPEAEMKQMKTEQKEESEPESASGVYTCPMDSHSHIVQMGPGKCPECGMKLVPAEETSGRTVFVCPMPEDSVVSAEPGRCPKCNMELVEMTFDEEKHEGYVHEMPKQTEEKSMPDEITGVYTCPMDSHSHILQMGPGECPECGMKLVPAEETFGRTAFICPMPQDSVVSATPGHCPKCGMNLVEKTIEGVQE
jgi:Cu(I)/Ag(I) efflux system membrane fusion protein/cobalt-zinc-cadmium efflux system membrane fusion protein